MYALTEIFYTLQGEGFHAGTPALFIRFAGCSMWSGKDEHRDRDADRNGAECPRFCDTDFIARARIDLAGLLESAVATAPEGLPLVVLTGGEPLLQLDQALVAGLRERFPEAIIAIETNGAHAIPRGVELDWICVSPKVAAERLLLREGDEIKVVVPAYDPAEFADVARGFTHRWISAEAVTTGVGRSLVHGDRLRAAAELVMTMPGWRLTLQSHKMIGIP